MDTIRGLYPEKFDMDPDRLAAAIRALPLDFLKGETFTARREGCTLLLISEEAPTVTVDPYDLHSGDHFDQSVLIWNLDNEQLGHAGRLALGGNRPYDGPRIETTSEAMTALSDAMEQAMREYDIPRAS